tara:strand:+ start:1558 stop:2319 length:762 start_codon:yes stop_codon:yes gene_type:complete
MGIRLIEATQLSSIMPYLKKTFKRDLQICVLGYPDLLFTLKSLQSHTDFKNFDLSNIIESDYYSELPFEKNRKKYVDPKSFFNLFNASFDVIDICSHRGNEIMIDLNYPNVTRLLSSKYDLVIDNGTLEHCFNIGEALINIARLVRDEGFIFHINPLVMINHGFYNISPTLFYDFYTANHFAFIKALASGNHTQQLIEVNPTKRFLWFKEFNGEESILNFTVSRKKSDGLMSSNYHYNYVYPTQSKYKNILAD